MAVRNFLMRSSASLLLLVSSCADVSNQLGDLVFVPHPQSDQRNGEKVELQLGFFNDQCPVDGPQPESVGPQLPFPFPGAGGAAEFATNIAGQMLAEESQRYEASYSAKAGDDRFYKVCPGKEPGVRLGALKLQRKVGGAHAFSLCAVIVPSEGNDMLRVVPLSYSLERTKTKVVAFNFLSPFGVELLNPWEAFTDGGAHFGVNDDNIDLRITMALDATWVAGDKFEEKQLREFSWTIPSARIGGDHVFIGPKHDCETVELETLVEYAGGARNERQALSSLQPQIYFPLVPRSKPAGADVQGLGIFNITMTVTEFDDYGERVKEMDASFQKNKDSWTQKVTDFLQ